jgi:glycosyltransferase involved in cell wall biosynthesis
MTYNHEPFIRQAMDGIMVQKVDFQVEVVVGDDFSTDNTLNVIRSYHNTDHIIVKILERVHGDEYWTERQKKGRLYNFENILKNCSGKYVALLDGDDYWTDPLKLQKQVEFLERNSDYSICFGDVRIVDENGVVLKDSRLGSGRQRDYSHEEIVGGALMPTASVLFRRDLIEYLTADFLNVVNADTFLFAMIGQYGRAHFCHDVAPCGYRRHSGGIWSFTNIIHQKESIINTFKKLSSNLGEHFSPITKKIAASELYELSKLQIRVGEYRKSIYSFMDSVRWAIYSKSGVLVVTIVMGFIKNYFQYATRSKRNNTGL